MSVSWFLVCVSLTLVNGGVFSGEASADTVDYTQVPIVEESLHTPPLEEIVDVLSRALVSNFETVSVTAEVSPDLTQEPYGLTSPGLCGNEKLIDLGGALYMLPSVDRSKVYDLAELIRQQGRDSALLIGSGAGPWPYIGVNCELIVNLSVRNGTIEQGSHAMSVYPVGAPKGSSGYLQTLLPSNETRVAVLGNYLLSDGSPGEVIKVVVKKRIGEADFITAIREALENHYGDKVVGLGGTFLLREGKVLHHVAPDFTATPWCDEMSEWLHYFEMEAPISHVGTLVTGDLGMDLFPQHFHGWSPNGDGGHYNYDTTPDTVEYEGYFTVARSAVRIDAPNNIDTSACDATRYLVNCYLILLSCMLLLRPVFCHVTGTDN